jgi:hypothetical protein
LPNIPKIAKSLGTSPNSRKLGELRLSSRHNQQCRSGKDKLK